jgi:hypothetical protein
MSAAGERAEFLVERWHHLREMWQAESVLLTEAAANAKRDEIIARHGLHPDRVRVVRFEIGGAPRT